MSNTCTRVNLEEGLVCVNSAKSKPTYHISIYFFMQYAQKEFFLTPGLGLHISLLIHFHFIEICVHEKVIADLNIQYMVEHGRYHFLQIYCSQTVAEFPEKPMTLVATCVYVCKILVKSVDG